MFKAMKLKKGIKKCLSNIEDLERRRSRSQAALVEAILTNIEPKDDDVDYFNRFSAQIDRERDRLHALQQELDMLEGR